MNNKNTGMFVIENKELTLNALNHVEGCLKTFFEQYESH